MAAPAAFGASLESGGIVVFGELHGTREAPAFVAEVVASVRSPVTLALEIPADVQPAIDTFDAGDGVHEMLPHWPGPCGVERIAIPGFDGVYRVGMRTPSEPLR